MATKDFFKKLQGAEDDFKKGRKGRRGMIEVDPGFYIVRGSKLVLDVNKKKEPYVSIQTVVVESSDESDQGSGITDMSTLVHRSGTKNGKSWAITVADQFANVCSSLKAFGFDTDELEMSDLEDLAEDFAEIQPVAKAEVKEKNGYLNVRFSLAPEDADTYPTIDDVLLDDDDDEEDDDDLEDEEEDDEEDDSDDSDDEDDEDDSDEDEDDDDDDDDDDDEDWTPEKGDSVLAKVKGAKTKKLYTVMTVNTKKETCTLKDAKGKQVKNVDWDRIEENSTLMGD